MNIKDEDIVKRLKQNDIRAFKLLFNKYYKPLSVYALQFCDSIEMAEDITQDFFIKFWDKKIYLSLDDKIKPYLYKSIKNNALKKLKTKNKYCYEIIENENFRFAIDETIDFDSLENERAKLLKQIEALPQKSKEVFKAIVLNNLKYKEVAADLNISINTVKTHYSRALKQLRKSLNIFVFW